MTPHSPKTRTAGTAALLGLSLLAGCRVGPKYTAPVTPPAPRLQGNHP